MSEQVTQSGDRRDGGDQLAQLRGTARSRVYVLSQKALSDLPQKLRGADGHKIRAPVALYVVAAGAFRLLSVSTTPIAALRSAVSEATTQARAGCDLTLVGVILAQGEVASYYAPGKLPRRPMFFVEAAP